MSYVDGDKFLDGPGLADWLESNFPDLRLIAGQSASRRLWDWRHHRTRATIDALDPILCSLGSHLTEVPDELWECDQRHLLNGRKRAAA